MPEVSVVVAAYNQAAWLDEAICGVRAQTFEDWELLVVDDGSTDDTPAVVARHGDDRRIRYVAQERQERSAARNRGIAETSAPLVAFLDADDCWRPEKLARQVERLAAEPDAGVCYTAARFIDADGRPLPLRKPPRAIAGRVFDCLLAANVIILSSVVVRRTALARAGGFALLPAYGCEDWDLWLRLARDGPVTVVDEELTLYRHHAGNTAWQQVLESAFAVIDRWTGSDGARAALRARHCWINAASLAADQPGAALALAGRALRESPGSALGRPAAATLAHLVLPRGTVRALRRLGA